jgi:phage terminase large subunit GpA-like protein
VSVILQFEARGLSLICLEARARNNVRQQAAARVFEMLVSERRVTRYVRGRPTTRFERIPGKRVETLDELVYATAAKAGLP